MKNKFIMFFTYSLFFSVNGYCQFNTVLQKKDIPKAEPVLATTENKLIEEKEKAVVVNDALTTERLAYWKQRRYLSLPIDSMVITSHYGKRKDPFTGKVANHRGIDLKGNNDYVYSIMPGMVVKTGKNKGLGNYVEVRHGDFTSIYGHLYSVSIRSTTGIKPLYTTIATVTMNLIVSAAIVLLNPYVTVYISYKIPPFALSVHIPDVSTSIYVEVDSKVLLGLPFCDKASGRLHHSGTPLGLHRVPYR